MKCCCGAADCRSGGEGGVHRSGDGGLSGDGELGPYRGLHGHERCLVPFPRHLHHQPGTAPRRWQVSQLRTSVVCDVFCVQFTPHLHELITQVCQWLVNSVFLVGTKVSFVYTARMIWAALTPAGCFSFFFFFYLNYSFIPNCYIFLKISNSPVP